MKTAVALIGLASLVATVAPPPITAEAAIVGHSRFVLSSTWFASDGWHWKFIADLDAGSLSLTVRSSRRLGGPSGPLEAHDWRFDLPPTELVTGHADLAPTTFDTGTDLGRFGAIDVSLEKGTTLTSRAATCPDTGAILARTRERTGTFAGTIDFKPDFLAPLDVAPPAFAGSIKKLSYTDNVCTAGGGTSTCPDTSLIDAFRATADGTGTFTAEDDPGSSFIEFDDFKTYPSHTRSDFMAAHVSSSAMVISADNAVVHSKAFGSFADGSIHLALGAGYVHRLSPTCIRTVYEVASQSGGVTAHFATGDLAFQTPFPHGVNVVVYTHT